MTITQTLNSRLDRIEKNTTVLLNSLEIIITQNNELSSIHEVLGAHAARIDRIENSIASNDRHTKSLFGIYIAIGFLYVGTAIHIAETLIG